MSQVQSLAETLASAQASQKFIIPQLVPVGSTILFNVAPDLDARILGQLIAYCAAGRKTFMSFGHAKESKVCYCSSRSNGFSDTKRFSLISERDPHSASQARARENLHIYRHKAETPLFLNSTYDQEIFAKDLPRGIDLLVIDDISSWLKYGKALDSIENSEVLAFFKKFNSKGISVVALDSKPKRNGPLAEAIELRDPANLIWLTPDSGAPREFGGGFNIVRQKRDDDDSVPTTIQFWWKVFNGKLDFGSAFRDQLDPKAAKKMQMMERQMIVDQLLSEGVSQREIAIQLQVDAATISRDAAALKQNEVRIDRPPEEDSA